VPQEVVVEVGVLDEPAFGQQVDLFEVQSVPSDIDVIAVASIAVKLIF
jgi:hypothetical protein